MDEYNDAIKRVRAYGETLKRGAPHQTELGADLVIVADIALTATRPAPITPDVSGMREQIDTLKARNIELEQDNARLEQDNARLEQDNARLRQDFVKLDSLRTDDAAQGGLIRTENEQLKQQVADLSSIVAEMRAATLNAAGTDPSVVVSQDGAVSQPSQQAATTDTPAKRRKKD